MYIDKIESIYIYLCLHSAWRLLGLYVYICVRQAGWVSEFVHWVVYTIYRVHVYVYGGYHIYIDYFSDMYVAFNFFDVHVCVRRRGGVFMQDICVSHVCFLFLR